MTRRCILTIALLAGLAAAGCDDANKAGPTGPQEEQKRGSKAGAGTMPKPPAIEKVTN